ncbi:hypothetical protein IGJ02_002190 [Enterococcus sp. DIV0724b]|uniref:winged helix-turn-helix domain-containing protein n=1 Tax=Enterococcus sp. DIV0724b TaxID=2774694 RepID=UPI003D2FAEBB
MYTISFLSKKEVHENEHFTYLTEKGWKVKNMNINEAFNNLDAVIIYEDKVATTCCWLMELTKKISVPIFLLSVGNEAHSNILYLQLGVKACFSLSTELEEVYLTIKNLLYDAASFKLQKQVNDLEERSINPIKGLELIPQNLSVKIDGKREIILTKKEYQAIEILYKSPAQTVSYGELQKRLWKVEQDELQGNYRIANVIFHLRTKIEENISNPRFIKTIRSKGYMFNNK